ncbi:MAG: outer membrane protein assembly factor BamA [Treponema sp.]|nr:outer membrane protein assembly factor BamA [Treponema sp.]
MKLRVIAFIMFTITVFTLFSQEEDDWYMGKPIRNITFSGLKNIAHSELEALIQPYTGIEFNEIIFWEIQGKLYALEYFDRIEPSVNPANAEGSEVALIFNVIERPVIGRINFSGNSGLRNRDLQDIISSRVSDILNQVKIRNDIQVIVSKYLERGYPNVTVNAEEAQARDGSIILTFRINEMERISISRVDFQGNSRFSANTLRSQLSLKAKSLINDGAFQEAKLILDRETLASYYHDRGYINAVVRDVTRTYEAGDKGGTNLILTFMIEEGSEFRFGGIKFEGNSIFTSEQLQKLVTSRTGDVVNISKIESDFQSINDLYFESGYIFNSINRTHEIDPQTNTLSFTVSIVERNRAYIESITVRGNEKTKTDVILREIPMEPGDVFSRTKILDAMRNLYNLQYFTIVMPDTLPGSAENLMDLVFTVEEQMTTDLQLGLTFSGNADPDALPVSGLFEFTDRNLAGSGNELGVKLNSSIVDSTTLAVNYLHRWIMGLPLSLGIDLTADFIRRQAPMANQNWWFNGDEAYAFPDGYNSYENFEANNKVIPSEYLMKYDEWYLSLGLSSGYRWPTLFGNFGLSGGIRFGILRNSYNEIYRPFDPVLRAGNDKWTPKNSLWTSASLDQRDIYYDPSNGYYALERLGLYGFFGNELEHYVRSDTKLQYFHTLFDIPVFRNWNFKSVLAVHAGLSLIFGQPGRGDPKVSKSNQLAVDGMFTGRGWSEKYSEKGLLLLDSWVEMRFPLVRGILAFDLFFDMAGIETEQGLYFEKDNFTINNLLFSFGGGLRLALPQFPIRLSVAKRFSFKDGEFQWEPGSLFGDQNNPAKGIDIIFSFVLSY